LLCVRPIKTCKSVTSQTAYRQGEIFNTPQLAAAVKKLNGEVLIATRILPVFAAGPE
jgi:hypothetical protein